MNELTCIGIDLGTSNCALSYFEESRLCVLEVEQISSPGASHKTLLLPSSIYICDKQEVADYKGLLSWDTSHDFVIGSWAKDYGSKNPDRFIHSAKSWLAKRSNEDIYLPYHSASDTQHKLTPEQASARYLEHLRHALYSKQQGEFVGDLVVTIPASFDQLARQKTRQAVEAAGFRLEKLNLLEEPLAAFYSWLHENKDTWREKLEMGDLVLVCDIGGGTCDFSLVAVSQADNELSFERISVGSHLLLGGDNMDLALAYNLAPLMSSEPLDDWQMACLQHQCRLAKERLLSDSSISKISVSIASRSSSLFDSALSAELTREQLEAVILEGFFPLVSFEEMPQESSLLGLQEEGLDYVREPAITKHLASFLKKSLQELDGPSQEFVGLSKQLRSMIVPDKLLFNGGVFHSRLLQNRVRSQLSQWFNREVGLLEASSLDLAVAKGAAYYARLKSSGEGLKVKAGATSSYYLGLAPSSMAIPGFKPKLKGLCVLKKGSMESEGLTEISRSFSLAVGQNVSFPVYSSKLANADQLGDIVDSIEDRGALVCEIKTSLHETSEYPKGTRVPVHLETGLDATGSLVVYLKDAASSQKWQLEFDVRAYD